MRRVATLMRARIILGVVAVLVLGAAGSAAAEAKRVGVPKFDGPQEAVIRKAVMQVLKSDGYEVVGSREVDAAARSAGVSLDSNDGYKAVARELSLASFVTGEVAKKKAKLVVRNGLDGTVSGEGSFAGATPAKVASEIRDGFGRRLGSAVARGRAPSGAKKPAPPPPPAADDEDEAPAPVAAKPLPKAAPVAEETKSEESGGEPAGAAPDVVEKKAEPAPEEAGEGYAPRALDLYGGFRLFHRSLTFHQDLYNALSDYSLMMGPALAVDAVLMPGAFFTGGPGGWVGVVLNVEQAFGVGASLASGQTLPTIVHDYAGGVVVRVPFSSGSEISLQATYGEHAFSLRSGDGVKRADVTTIPDTIYRYARIGAGGRLMLGGGFSLNAKLGFRAVLNKGGQDRLQIAYDGTPADPTGYFPHLKVMAFDVGAGFGYLVTPAVEIRFNFDLRQYGFAMNSQPGQYPDGDFNGNTPVVKIAGGATDQYISGTLGVAYVFGGVRPGARPAVEEEAPPAEEPKKKAKKKKAKKPADDEDEDGGDSGGDDDSED